MTRAETIMRSAELRSEMVLDALGRAFHGDDEYHREVAHVNAMETLNRDEPPPATEARHGVNPLYGWNKRLGGK